MEGHCSTGQSSQWACQWRKKKEKSGIAIANLIVPVPNALLGSGRWTVICEQLMDHQYITVTSSSDDCSN